MCILKGMILAFKYKRLILCVNLIGLGVLRLNIISGCVYEGVFR